MEKSNFGIYDETELKEGEMLRERMTTLQLVDPYVGKYYSALWVRKNILQQTDDDIEEIDAENEEYNQEQLNKEVEEMKIRGQAQAEVSANSAEMQAQVDQKYGDKQ